MRSNVKCICSCCTADLQHMRLCTNLTKKKYSDLHNIDFVIETIPSNYDRHPAWYKIKFVSSLFDKYETIMYIDSDAGFVSYDNDIDDYIQTDFDIALAKTDERIEYAVYSLQISQNNY